MGTVFRRTSGFTFIGLLSVIAIITIFTGLLLPSLGNAKSRALAARCMNNEKKLALAWTAHAQNNNGLFVPNEDNFSGGWIAGVLSYNGSNANTNLNNLTNPVVARLAPYIVDHQIHKCPADESKHYGDQGPARIRTISMNAAIGPNISGAGGGKEGRGGWLPYPAYRVFVRESELIDPGPSRTWIFADENPDSINDPSMAVIMATPEIVDFPSTLHNNACVFAFADGHVEMKKWSRRMRNIKTLYRSGNPDITRSNWGWDDPDLKWIRLRTSSASDGSPVR